MPATPEKLPDAAARAGRLPDHLRNRCLAPTAVELFFSAVPKPVRMPKAPESANPDAPKRKRGGQPGNTNRLKHGRYSAFAMPLDPDAEPAPPGWLLEEQLIDFGPRRRGAQPGNMNRMIHGARSVRTRANNQRMKALLARGKAILAICNALAAMAERLVAQREAAAAEAIKNSEFSAPHLLPFTGEDEGTQPHKHPDSAVPMPVRISARPENRPNSRSCSAHRRRRTSQRQSRSRPRSFHRSAVPAALSCRPNCRPVSARNTHYRQGSCPP